MLLFAALASLPLAFAQGTLDADPSLAPAATCGAPTAAADSSAYASASGLLVNYAGCTLNWSNITGFSLSVDGIPVTDLVTYKDARGWHAFKGLFDSKGDPAVYGAVDSPSGAKWSVELTRPSHRPYLLEVYADKDDAIISAASRCDCSDSISTNCNSTKCTNNETCDGTGPICKYVPIASS
jgi:hypothetical protein